MDLSKYNTRKGSEEGAWVEIYAPDETETKIKIKVLGRDSDTFQSKIKRVAEQNRQKKKGLTIAELERQSMEAYVACTEEWENVDDKKGPVECTPENIRDIYKEYPWIFEQVQEFVEDRSNFL